MSSPADVLCSLLQARGFSDGGWSLFVAFLPDAPDSAICLYDTEGRKDGRLMSSGKMIGHPGVQVMVRCLSYADGWKKAESIATLFDGVRKDSVDMGSEGDYIIDNVSRTSPVESLGVEEINNRRRHLFVINAFATLNQS